jgi:hypothetical protein
MSSVIERRRLVNTSMAMGVVDVHEEVTRDW